MKAMIFSIVNCFRCSWVLQTEWLLLLWQRYNLSFTVHMSLLWKTVFFLEWKHEHLFCIAASKSSVLVCPQLLFRNVKSREQRWYLKTKSCGCNWHLKKTNKCDPACRQNVFGNILPETRSIARELFLCLKWMERKIRWECMSAHKMLLLWLLMWVFLCFFCLFLLVQIEVSTWLPSLIFFFFFFYIKRIFHLKHSLMH